MQNYYLRWSDKEYETQNQKSTGIIYSSLGCRHLELLGGYGQQTLNWQIVC